MTRGFPARRAAAWLLRHMVAAGMQKGPPRTGRAFLRPETQPGEREEPLPRLLGWSWGEPFALAAGLWFGFGLRRLLDFFSAFVFASHGDQCATKGGQGERAKEVERPHFRGAGIGRGGSKSHAIALSLAGFTFLIFRSPGEPAIIAPASSSVQSVSSWIILRVQA